MIFPYTKKRLLTLLIVFFAGIVIFILGKVSGGNFNPAVSVMLAMAGKLSMKDLAPYVVAQVLGGLAALELYKRVKL